ncbi:nitrogenase component 1 [Motiliproteus sediminis]|uniref:nitrogenase component 1 n=1 Tax=Motiliproteus sediminis TaxID=1468178 RepID=UPI001AEF92FD|nr:nitrogenase component 1 [Motiliproteus sediminis]
MPGCELPASPAGYAPKLLTSEAISRCVLSQADSRALALAQLASEAARCTARARQLSPIQSSTCQPLGAWHCASGFADCAAQVVGGDACVRHFNRYLEQQGYLLKPASPAAEAAAPVAGVRVMIDTCLEREHQGSSQDNLIVAEAPSFVGNQSQGWDAMFATLVQQVRSGDQPIASGESLNLVLGFEHFAANYRIMQQLLSPFGIRVQLLSDPRARLEPEQYANQRATSMAQLQAAAGADDTLLVRPWQLPRSRDLIRQRWGHAVTPLPVPMGLAWTDAWLTHLSRMSGQEVPALTQLERFRLCEAIHDALPLICRQRFAVVGEPDFVMGISRYLIELGAGPALILCQNGNQRWREAMLGLLNDCGYQGDVVVKVGSLCEHLARLLHETPADLLLAPPALSAADLAPEGLPATLRRVALEQAPEPGEHPATLGYAGARHILNAILRTVRSP